MACLYALKLLAGSREGISVLEKKCKLVIFGGSNYRDVLGD